MRSPSASPRSFRPVLEALEGRTLLSVCTVDRLTDLGQGTGMVGDLRYCITQLQNGDSIRFGVTGTVSLTGALPDLTRSISIEGPGANLLSVRRNTGGLYRIFTVGSAAALHISGLTMANGISGYPASGGGIFNAGTLTVTASTVSGNSGSQHGGGIHNEGTLTVTDSTLSGNSATFGYGGGIYNAGTLAVSNSTLTGNTARADFGVDVHGGGIFNSSSGIATVSNSTITGNTALGFLAVGRGGGIANQGTLTLRNTILAGSNANQGPDFWGSLASSGYNLIGNSSGGSGFVATDLLDVNPLLGPLQDNGGPTQTHALLPGSPAINAGDPAAGHSLTLPKWDQRGEGFWRIAGGRLDIGAFEVLGRGSWGPGADGDVARSLEFNTYGESARPSRGRGVADPG